ncbi:MAG: class I SAM-dependent methyltransferase [Patescibacteria group bacterium]
MSYNQIYKKRSVWGDEPNILLRQIFEKLTPKDKFLDLGCGQGRDVLFMLAKGFRVTGVDASPESINHIKNLVKINRLSTVNFELVCGDISSYIIKDDMFDIINAYNSLQFLSKKDAFRVLENIKNNIKKNGYIIISGFTIDDPLYKKIGNDKRCFFERGELKKIFSEADIILYNEEIINENGHAGNPEPHIHGITRIIAQKNIGSDS